MSDEEASTRDYDVSVVIPAFKRPELLRQALASVLAQDHPADRFEVIVVDSSPDDRNAMLVEEMAAATPGIALRVLRKTPEGPGPSRMHGAHAARSEIIAFMDSDCRARPDWLRNGLAKFATDIGIVQGRTRPDPEQPRTVFSRYVTVEEENPRYEAANIFYRRSCLEQLGDAPRDMTPNSERPMGGEDAMMAWQVKRAGWRSTFAGDALVYHEVIAVSVWFWLFDKRMFMLPWLVREIPEMRRVFPLGVFLEPAHGYLLIALAGLALMPWSAMFLALALPYVLFRGLEPSRTLTGMKRIVRVLAYLPRDLIAFFTLALGSARFGSLVL